MFVFCPARLLSSVPLWRRSRIGLFFEIFPLFFPYFKIPFNRKRWQARRDLNPQHPDLESGALSIRATGLCQYQLFGLPVQFVPPAKLAIFFHFQAVLRGTFIFRRGVISLLAFRASQNNIIPHNSPLT